MSIFPSPYGGQNREKLTPKQYLKGILGTLAIIVFIFFYVNELWFISNTLEVKSLIIYSLLVCGIIGAFIAFNFAKKLTDPFEKFKMYPFFIILSLLAAPFLGSFTNRNFSYSQKQKTEVEFFKQVVYVQSRFGRVKHDEFNPDGLFLFFIKDQEIQRVKTKKLLFPDAKRGDRVYIVTKKGLWGYEYFLEE